MGLTRNQVQVGGNLPLVGIARCQYHAQFELLAITGLLDQRLHPSLEQGRAIVRAVVRLKTQGGHGAPGASGMLQAVRNAFEYPGCEGCP
jgi:hypothetical protein